MTNYAPVLICTLNRHLHFKRCIESLSECTLASKTDLFIAFDYPSKENQWDGYMKIKEQIDCISGFQSVNIIKRQCNYGVNKNTYDAISFIFEKYEKLILAEDDLEFSYDFLSFLNQALEINDSNEYIFSISGYNFPIQIPSDYLLPIYIWTGFAGWGCGIWKRKWQKLDFSEKVVFRQISDFLKNVKDVWRMNRIAGHIIPALIYILSARKVNGDGYICMYQFQNKMYSVFPTVSRVRNWGLDGSGVNCGLDQNDIYKKQAIYTGTSSYELPKKIFPSKEINKILRRHYKISLMSQFKIAIKLFLLHLSSKRTPK